MSTFRIFLAGILSCVAIWLVVTAPPELPDTDQVAVTQRSLDVKSAFNAVNAVNDAARTIYTARVVGPGLKAGLKFGEDWSEPGVDKGPSGTVLAVGSGANGNQTTAVGLSGIRRSYQ